MPNETLIHYTNSPEETSAIGAALAEKLGRKPGFIAMYGDLGAGKTAFVRGLASVLTPDALVKSPTFSIVNEYRAADGFAVYHFDMYRITDDDELYSTGFYDYLETGLCVAEWCENIPFAIPEDAIRVEIEYNGENKRKITITF